MAVPYKEVVRLRRFIDVEMATIEKKIMLYEARVSEDFDRSTIKRAEYKKILVECHKAIDNYLSLLEIIDNYQKKEVA